MKKITKTFTGICAGVIIPFAITGCAGNAGTDTETTTVETTAEETTIETTAAQTQSSNQDDTQESSIDYMALVNKENKLPDNWESEVSLTKSVNSLGDEVETEEKAYAAYLELKEDLESEGVKVDLDSAYRSIAAQEEIVKDFTEKYGETYVQQYVAVPGFSEHHTGLALDLYLNIDGEDVYYNEDMVNYPEVWEKIHEKLADHGFILRYLEGKESITGYNYEPWHIRYLDDEAVAKEIMDKGITLEEYLGILPQGDVTPPQE